MLFISTTTFIIVVCEWPPFRPVRLEFAIYYLIAFWIPLILSVSLVDRCEQFHLRSHRIIRKSLLDPLSNQTRPDCVRTRQLMSAFNMVRFGMKESCLTAWGLLLINRKLPLQYYSLNISVIVMIYNLIKPFMLRQYKLLNQPAS